MLVLFLLQDDHEEKLYSDPSEFISLLYNDMPSSSTSAATLDVTPPSPPPSSANKCSTLTTPPKGSTANASLQVQDTPFVIKRSGTIPHSSMTDPKADIRNLTLAQESLGYFVGPVDLDYFLEYYVPDTEKKLIFDTEKAKRHEERIRRGAEQSESAMYTPFLEMMKDMLSSEPREFKIVQTANRVLTDFFGSDIKPDFIIHEGAWKEEEEFQLQNIELMIELKYRKRFDPFVDDNKQQFEGATEKSEDSLGQSICYGACHQSMQGRTFEFQILVIEDYARLLRWDRSGAIVTRKIPLSDRKFFEFFWRFRHLTPEERGWDMTMSMPSQGDLDTPKAKLLEAEKKLGIDGGSQHFGRISLGTGKGSYIVHRIFSGTQSPFGRGTRGYAAYREKDGKIVFLKSTWRVVGEGRMPEHEIYDVLHAKGVKHIPTVVEYVEVNMSNHVTKTQDTPKSWRKANVKKLRKFQHYIIVFEELCRPLDKFQSRKQLLTAFADAADAHQEALKEASILHRDVSAGNILITKDGNGLLGDWDLAKHLDDIEQGQPERTGTFQFLSARFVSNKYNFPTPHERLDDIESFFHTLQWIVLRCVNHGMSPKNLGSTLYITFDAAVLGDKGLVICEGRASSIQNSIWAGCVNLGAVLLNLLEDLRKTISSRYIPATDMDRAEQNYAIYRTFLQGPQSDLALDESIYSHMIQPMRDAAMPAIIYEQLKKADWFRERLRQAAKDQCPAGDGSILQDYVPPPIQGSKRTTKSQKFSVIEYYRHISKKLKLDTSVREGDQDADSDSGAEDHDEPNRSSANDSDESYQKPRTRKIPYGKV